MFPVKRVVRRCLLLSFVLILVLFSLDIYAYYRLRSDMLSEVRLCYEHEPNNSTSKADWMRGLQLLDDVLLAEHKPSPGKNIFFHETLCRKHGSTIPMAQLKHRQACAIESAALHNPNYSVYVLYASPVYMDTTNVPPLFQALLSYSNVHLFNLNLKTFTAGTPIGEWYKTEELFNSKYLVEHMSDLLRFISLWRWGGIYLDLDIIVIRSLDEIYPNFVGVEVNGYLNNAVMSFAPTGVGHDVVEKSLLEFQRRFDGNKWSHNGPGSITRALQELCNTTNTNIMLERKDCNGFKIFPRDTFYNILWNEWKEFFEPQYRDLVFERLNSSYVVHIWNKITQGVSYRKGYRAAYEILAEENCPNVFALMGTYI